MENIQNVLILGAGTMGIQIGLQCAASGFDVMIYDPVASALESAKKRLVRQGSLMVKNGRFPREKIKQGLERISLTNDPETAGKDADLVSESVPEDPALKQKVLGQFHSICEPHTLFTTNSSTLLPSQLAPGTGRPDRFMALHFHDCTISNVVDVMPHAGTSQETLTAVTDFARAIDQYPIVLKKEQNGYVFNTMLSELLGAALSLAAGEVAAVPDIDRAWMGIMGTRVGPFGIMDAVGLDTVYKITAHWAEKTGHPGKLANADFLKSYVDGGNLGIKAGRGFYTYPHPEFMSPEFMEGIH
ncbi:MAG: 3-hydroxyacyl-CoA dehydrogenase [Desulfobacterales bacterium]|nr:3-hydroxyacyl-CoA dehydrogenase [Desulfobacterales bacterium]